MPNYPYAKYSISFKEFYEEEPTWLGSNLIMSTTARTDFLINALKAMWDVYEISGENIGEFKLFLLDTFNLHKKYYEEMLDNYEKQFDFTTGLTRRSGNTSVQKTINVELPNKSVDASDIYKYPDNADKNDFTNDSWSYDPAAFTKLKTQYMRQIRNLYNEFAMKFTDCFIHIF